MSDSPAAEAAQPGDRSVAVSTEGQRRAKVERLREAGVDPYPHSFRDRTHVEEIEREHDPAELGEGEHEQFVYRVMGRVTGKRGHGKTAFLDVRDITGTIQAYARRDVLGEEAFERVEELDIGDLVGIVGPLHVTKRGQLAIVGGFEDVYEFGNPAPHLLSHPNRFNIPFRGKLRVPIRRAASRLLRPAWERSCRARREGGPRFPTRRRRRGRPRRCRTPSPSRSSWRPGRRRRRRR